MAGIKKAQATSVEVSIDLGDGVIVDMAFRPHADGYKEAKEFQRKLEASEDEEENQRMITDRFGRTVIRWDLQDFRCSECNAQLEEATSKCPEHPEASVVGPAGSPGNCVIPLSREGLSDVPALLLSRLLMKGYEEAFSVKKSGKRASNSS